MLGAWVVRVDNGVAVVGGHPVLPLVEGILGMVLRLLEVADRRQQVAVRLEDPVQDAAGIFLGHCLGRT